MGLTYKEIESIVKILEAVDSDVIRFESGDFRFEMQRSGTAHVVPDDMQEAPMGQTERSQGLENAHTGASTRFQEQVATEETVKQVGAEDVPDGCYAIKAPMLGTFYRSPSPDEPAFVEVDSKIKPEDTIGLIEVMKLFNSIPARQSGTVVEILAEDGRLVEHGQILMIIKSDS